MNAIIDTSSLLAFVRYYLPFDKDGKLKNFLEEKYEGGEILVLDKVLEESKYTAKGLVLKELDFLVDKSRKSKIVDTKLLLPFPKFFNMLENQFCNKVTLNAKGLTDTEFELEKTKYLETADAKIMLFALNNRSNNPIVVTEETVTPNDNKIFRKIPDNCNAVGIDCCTLPKLLTEHFKSELGDFVIRKAT